MKKLLLTSANPKRKFAILVPMNIGMKHLQFAKGKNSLHFLAHCQLPIAFFLLLTAHCLLPAFSFAQLGSWSAKANYLGAGRTSAVGFSIGSYGYIGTGNTGITAKDFWRYDPAANSWSQMSDFGGTARYGAAGFSIGNSGYMGTGYDGAGYKNDFWKYDVAGNSWTPIANFGGTARFYAAGFSIGTDGYVGTGMNGSVAYNDFWQYNSLTDTWVPKANFTGSVRADCFAFAISGKGYIGCGRNFAGTTFYNTFYEYDPIANSWTPRANFGGTVREGASAFVIGNYGYAGTGSISNFSTQYTDFYKYDPVGNAWTAVATFIGTARTNAAAFAVGNYGYLGTGYAGAGFTATFYQYDLCGITTTVTATAPSCNGGSNGSVNLTVSNATNPLTYSWSNASTVQDPTGLSAGGYTVTVTDGAGCTKTTTVTVTQPTVLAGNVTTVTNASCYSMCNGKITVAASGATPPYTYSWSPSVSSTATASNLCAGNYSVTITDSKGCTALLDTVITQPSALVAAAGGTNATSGCSCDGAVNATVTGGTAPFTYLWSTGCTTSICSNICGNNSAYTVTATDSKGCSVMDTVSILPTPMIVTISCTNISCNGGSDGSSTVSVSGGASPYSYSWNTGATSATITGLSQGCYTVTITDADGCTQMNTCCVAMPAVLQVFNINTTANSSGCLCDGTVSANVVGGTTPYTYNWSSGCTTMSCTGVCSGIYTVSVTDAMGCTATKTTTVTGPMPFLIDSVNSSPASCPTCNNGSATATISGGTGPFTYAWTPSGQNTQTATGLLPGNYTVCVTDADNCTLCDSIYVGSVVGINEISSSTMYVSPNPSSGEFTIYNAQCTMCDLEIYNIMGEKIYSDKIANRKSYIAHLNFHEGIYFLKIKSENAVITKKIILNR